VTSRLEQRNPQDGSAPSSLAPTGRRFSLAWGRQRWWVEVLTILVGYGIYEVIQGAAPSRLTTAYANGRQVHRWQQDLHIDIDLSVNHFVNLNHEWLGVVMGYYYDTLNYTITPAVLLWVWFRRGDVYARWRSALILASMIGLVIYWAYPVAPPRFVVPGTVDTLVVHGIFGTTPTKGAGTLVNECAAMPSLHVGWSFWCAITIIGTTTVWWRWFALLYPVGTTLVVLGTGNHYILDGVGGVIVVSAGILLTTVPAARSRSKARLASANL
jgi:hypothetical protein